MELLRFSLNHNNSNNNNDNNNNNRNNNNNNTKWVGFGIFRYFPLLGFRGPYLLMFFRGFKAPTR